MAKNAENGSLFGDTIGQQANRHACVVCRTIGCVRHQPAKARKAKSNRSEAYRKRFIRRTRG
jgi:hypothetical protein